MTAKIWSKFYPKSLFGKIIFWIILMKLISLFLPIEFNHNGFRENFKFYHNLILTLLLFIYISFGISSYKSNLDEWLKILLILLLSVVFLIITSVVLINGICHYEEAETIFKEKDGGNALIVSRSRNFGATSADSYDTFYTKPITPFFNFIKKCDSKTIDQSKWTKPTYGNKKTINFHNLMGNNSASDDKSGSL